MSTRLAADTPLEIELRQTRAWAAMTAAQKADLITGLSNATRELALAGIRHRYPSASPRECFLRLAMLTMGRELARLAYPEIDRLDLR
ncbi:MAG TPA: hypothetical protein VM096_15925 [Vicinamibacterales bacterium]|nr:hypothetical protein [Vicinamibacterales bacterium]